MLFPSLRGDEPHWDFQCTQNAPDGACGVSKREHGRHPLSGHCANLLKEGDVDVCKAPLRRECRCVDAFVGALDHDGHEAPLDGCAVLQQDKCARQAGIDAEDSHNFTSS